VKKAGASPLWGAVKPRGRPINDGMTPPSVSHRLVTPFAITTLSLLVVFATVASGGGRDGDCHGNSPKKPCADIEPSEGASVRGTVTVRATFANASFVAGVQFQVDGANVGPEDTTAPYEAVWDTTGIPNGGHALTATAREADASLTTARNDVTVDNPTPDTTTPSVRVTAPAGGSTVSGQVTIAADASDNVGVTGVQFKLDGANLGGEDTAAPFEAAWDTTKSTDGQHGLTAVARDAAGNAATSSVATVTVKNAAPAPAPDTTPPSAQLTSPTAGATLSGQVPVSANASDNVGVSSVQFKLDGANLGAADTSAPYAVAWDTTASTNALHSLVAVARDAAGNTTTTSTTTVTVKNATSTTDTAPPAIQLTSPASGATVAGQVTIAANASDNVAVAGVQFKLDGVNLGSEDTAAPYAATWDTTKTTNASHTITAVARDAAGNTTTTAATIVNVNNPALDTTPPTVQITSPAAGSTVTSQVTIGATASDNVAVVGVQFKIDGANMGAEDTTAPYATAWDTTKTTNASHTITAVARDAAGNVKSSQVTATVANPSSTGAKLTWSPPALTSPITVNVPSSTGRVYMDASRDYIVNVDHLTACGGLWLEGGRNVVVVGGRITIPGPCASAYDRTAIKVRSNYGTVHLEGILIDGSYTHDGIVTASPNTTLQVENVRVERLQALDSNHPDCLQTQGGLGSLRVDRFSCSTPLQGFFLKIEGGNRVGPADIRRTNFRGAFHAFWQETTSVGPITLTDVWIGSSQRTFGLDVWPQSDAYGQTDSNRRAVLSSDGSYLWFTNSNITGRINKGIPSTGDFVPSGVAGAAYSSPGYV
jgi:YD repeat-containing protein